MEDYFPLCPWRSDRICDQCANELSGEKIIRKSKRKGKQSSREACKADQSSSHDRIGSRCDRAGNVRADTTANGNNWQSDEQYCRFYSADAELGTGIYAQ